MKPHQTVLAAFNDKMLLIYDHEAHRLTRLVPSLGVSVELDPSRWWSHMALTRRALQACNLPVVIHQHWRGQ